MSRCLQFPLWVEDGRFLDVWPPLGRPVVRVHCCVVDCTGLEEEAFVWLKGAGLGEMVLVLPARYGVLLRLFFRARCGRTAEAFVEA